MQTQSTLRKQTDEANLKVVRNFITLNLTTETEEAVNKKYSELRKLVLNLQKQTGKALERTEFELEKITEKISAAPDDDISKQEVEAKYKKSKDSFIASKEQYKQIQANNEELLRVLQLVLTTRKLIHQDPTPETEGVINKNYKALFLFVKNTTNDDEDRKRLAIAKDAALKFINPDEERVTIHPKKAFYLHEFREYFKTSPAIKTAFHLLWKKEFIVPLLENKINRQKAITLAPKISRALEDDFTSQENTAKKIVQIHLDNIFPDTLPADIDQLDPDKENFLENTLSILQKKFEKTVARNVEIDTLLRASVLALFQNISSNNHSELKILLKSILNTKLHNGSKDKIDNLVEKITKLSPATNDFNVTLTTILKDHISADELKALSNSIPTFLKNNNQKLKLAIIQALEKYPQENSGILIGEVSQILFNDGANVEKLSSQITLILSSGELNLQNDTLALITTTIFKKNSECPTFDTNHASQLAEKMTEFLSSQDNLTNRLIELAENGIFCAYNPKAKENEKYNFFDFASLIQLGCSEEILNQESFWLNVLTYKTYKPLSSLNKENFFRYVRSQFPLYRETNKNEFKNKLNQFLSESENKTLIPLFEERKNIYNNLQLLKIRSLFFAEDDFSIFFSNELIQKINRYSFILDLLNDPYFIDYYSRFPSNINNQTLLRDWLIAFEGEKLEDLYLYLFQKDNQRDIQELEIKALDLNVPASPYINIEASLLEGEANKLPLPTTDTQAWEALREELFKKAYEKYKVLQNNNENYAYKKVFGIHGAYHAFMIMMLGRHSVVTLPLYFTQLYYKKIDTIYCKHSKDPAGYPAAFDAAFREALKTTFDKALDFPIYDTTHDDKHLFSYRAGNPLFNLKREAFEKNLNSALSLALTVSEEKKPSLRLSTIAGAVSNFVTGRNPAAPLPNEKSEPPKTPIETSSSANPATTTLDHSSTASTPLSVDTTTSSSATSSNKTAPITDSIKTSTDQEQPSDPSTTSTPEKPTLQPTLSPAPSKNWYQRNKRLIWGIAGATVGLTLVAIGIGIFAGLTWGAGIPIATLAITAIAPLVIKAVAVTTVTVSATVAAEVATGVLAGGATVAAVATISSTAEIAAALAPRDGGDEEFVSAPEPDNVPAGKKEVSVNPKENTSADSQQDNANPPPKTASIKRASKRASALLFNDTNDTADGSNSPPRKRQSLNPNLRLSQNIQG